MEPQTLARPTGPHKHAQVELGHAQSGQSTYGYASADAHLPPQDIYTKHQRIGVWWYRLMNPLPPPRRQCAVAADMREQPLCFTGAQSLVALAS